MKLPESIKGRNKIRDAQICLLFEEWHDSELPATEDLKDIWERIAVKMEMTEGRVRQILRLNHSYIPVDKALEKKLRILHLKREVTRAGHSKKDVADLLEQLRKEIEGETALIDNRKYVTIYRPEQYAREDVEAASRSTDRSF
jgi:hypothetical protein